MPRSFLSLCTSSIASSPPSEITKPCGLIKWVITHNNKKQQLMLRLIENTKRLHVAVCLYVAWLDVTHMHHYDATAMVYMPSRFWMSENQEKQAHHIYICFFVGIYLHAVVPIIHFHAESNRRMGVRIGQNTRICSSVCVCCVMLYYIC